VLLVTFCPVLQNINHSGSHGTLQQPFTGDGAIVCKAKQGHRQHVAEGAGGDKVPKV